MDARQIMARARDAASDWQLPIVIVRIGFVADARVSDHSLDEIRSALEGAATTGLRLVVERPDLVLIAGGCEWVVNSVGELRGRGDPKPIVVLNTGGGTREIACVLDAGADDCLTYPFDPLELRARIQAVMRRLGTGSTRCPEVEADFRTHSIRLRAVEARVSPKQFETFICLAEQRERWVHTDEIIATVSGAHHDPATSLVRVQIHALRKALGAARDCIRSDGHKSYMLTLVPNVIGASSPPDR